MNVHPDGDIRRTIAANLRALRKARGWTQEEAGRLLGVHGVPPCSNVVWSAMEATADHPDRLRNFTAEEIAALAALFEVTPNDLFGGPRIVTCPSCSGTGRVALPVAGQPLVLPSVTTHDPQETR